MNNIANNSKRMPLWAQLYFLLTLAVLAFGFHKAITAPTEATMGNLYRVFFYHFPHTILSFVFPYLNCGASLLYLYWRSRNPSRALAADAFALASAELTVLYASVGLATGMLWGRAAWQPLSTDDGARGPRHARHGVGRGLPLLRHRAALRSRPVGDPLERVPPRQAAR